MTSKIEGLLVLYININLIIMSSAYKKALAKKKTAETSLFDSEIKPDQEVEDKSSLSASDKEKSDEEVKQEDKVKKSEEKKVNKTAEAGRDADSMELSAFKDADPSSKEWKNRQRTLVLCARGVNSRFRHLMNDLIDLLPHAKKENKIERKIAKDYINDLCF